MKLKINVPKTGIKKEDGVSEFPPVYAHCEIPETKKKFIVKILNMLESEYETEYHVELMGEELK